MITEPWKKGKWGRRFDVVWRLFLLFYVTTAALSIAFTSNEVIQAPSEPWDVGDRVEGVIMLALLVHAGWELFVWRAERKMQKFVNNAVKDHEKRMEEKGA